MGERFARHLQRRVQRLDGLWDFAFLGAVNVDALRVPDIACNDILAVPGCFDACARYAGKRGVAAYRSEVATKPGQRYRLQFRSVQFWSRVFVDGQLLVEKALGFAPFHADFTASRDRAQITVLVDNCFDQRNFIQFQGYDWYHFGGIDASVELHELGPAWIEDLRLVTTDLQTRAIHVTLSLSSTRPCQLPLQVRWRDHMIAEKSVTCTPAGQTESFTIILPHAELWDCDRPHLHTLHFQLGDHDDRIERFGLREVGTRDGQILLNNMPVRLLGVNYHLSHPQSGSSLSDETLISDFQLIRDMGCNFVRTAHYPPDRRVLDLCDELGLLVWSESLGWGLRDVELQNADIAAALVESTHALAQVVANHPSVILVGFLNECASDAGGARDRYEKLATIVRTECPGTLVSYASNRPEVDQCLDLVDVISLNTYPGWYYESLEGMPADLRKNLTAFSLRPGASGKPIVISEIGAEALPGWRDWHDERWSERYQAQMLETAFHTVFNLPLPVAGFAVWQFSDFRTSTVPRMMLMRPRGHNNKGIVDQHRVPKLAYDKLKALYHHARTSAGEGGFRPQQIPTQT